MAKDTAFNNVTVRDMYALAFLPAILAESYRQIASGAHDASDGTWTVPEVAMKMAFELADKALIERMKK